MTTVAHDNAQATRGPAVGGQPTVTPVSGSKLGVPARPQVNLLPPEVARRRAAAAAQRRMIWAVIATIILIVVAFGGAFLVRADAALRQEEALATADALLQEKREYSPVVEVLSSIDSTREARDFVLTTEVNWASYVFALAAVLPEGITIDEVAIESAGAGDDLVEGADALTTNGIGVMTFVATSPTLPEASEWIDALESIPGLADANLQSTELTDEAGETTYDVNATVQVTVDATANRAFSDELAEESAADAEEAADGADAEGGE